MSDTYQAIYDAARSRIHGGDVSQAVESALREAFGNTSHQIQQALSNIEYEATEVIRATARPSVLYRPSIGRDGNKWLALYGSNLMEGVCGFGDSPEEAMVDFDANWVNKVAQAKPVHADPKHFAPTHYNAFSEASKQVGAEFDTLRKTLDIKQTTPSAAARDVLAERERQVVVEMFDDVIDDAYWRNGELAGAAASYAISAMRGEKWSGPDSPAPWPWDEAWWKPTTPRRDLVKAGALILAEIERIDRAEKEPK